MRNLYPVTDMMKHGDIVERGIRVCNASIR